MKTNDITEEKVIFLIKKILNYNQKLADSPYRVKIITSQDELSKVNIVSWYRYVNGAHKLYFNVPKILSLALGVKRNLIDNNTFYTLVTLIVEHEYRHLQQGKVSLGEKNLRDYSEMDAYNMELMMYIRHFYDNYYLKNRAYVKYELDAEKFAVVNGVNFWRKASPKHDAEKLLVDAVNYLGLLQSKEQSSTLPTRKESLKEIIEDIDKRIMANLRIWELNETLTVSNPSCYRNQKLFGLHNEKVLSQELSDAYFEELRGCKQDELIVNRIIDSLDYPAKSLKSFPALQRKYNL